MNKFNIGPTGALVQGTIYDCKKSSLENAIKSYDPLLYIKWNPTKNYGMGCWELRRRPEKKSVKQSFAIEGVTYHHLDYVELDLVNHIFDLPILSYSVIERIKKADVWAKADYDGTNLQKVTTLLDKIEEKRLALQAAHKEKNMADTMYAMKQFDSQLEVYRQAILDGQNPADLVKYMPI